MRLAMHVGEFGVVNGHVKIRVKYAVSGLHHVLLLRLAVSQLCPREVFFHSGDVLISLALFVLIVDKVWRLVRKHPCFDDIHVHLRFVDQQITLLGTKLVQTRHDVLI
jgi:hypothetical protein